MYTISDVADLLGIVRLSGGDENEFPVVCPFCGDKRGKCNFRILKDGEFSNVYHCFDCGACGNMHTLYAEMMGIYGKDRYKEASREIRERIPYDKKERRNIEREQRKRIRKQKAAAVEIATEEYRNQVYQTMLEYLSLEELHRENLRRRGLSAKEILQMERKGYKSIRPEESVVIARRLIKQGHRLQGIPGFFVNRNGDWEAAFYEGNKGYLCPVYSVEGLLVAFQIRMDKPIKNKKYTWLTSAKMEKGCSSGSPVGMSGKLTGSVVGVTEGILKAEITRMCWELPMLGNPGVTNYKELRNALEQLKEKGLKEVLEFYDMDKMMGLACRNDYNEKCEDCQESGRVIECPKKRDKRDKIRSGCLKLYEICQELSLSCHRMVWDQGKDGIWQENYKGIDDWETEKRKETLRVA